MQAISASGIPCLTILIDPFISGEPSTGSSASSFLAIILISSAFATTLDGKSERIQKMADILTNLSRRR